MLEVDEQLCSAVERDLLKFLTTRTYLSWDVLCFCDMHRGIALNKQMGLMIRRYDSQRAEGGTTVRELKEIRQ